jgi:hypothetical protein
VDKGDIGIIIALASLVLTVILFAFSVIITLLVA